MRSRSMECDRAAIALRSSEIRQSVWIPAALRLTRDLASRDDAEYAGAAEQSGHTLQTIVQKRQLRRRTPKAAAARQMPRGREPNVYAANGLSCLRENGWHSGYIGGSRGCHLLWLMAWRRRSS